MNLQTAENETTKKSDAMEFKSLGFWRNIVGVAFLLLAQDPRLYSNGMAFFGLWLGTLVISLGGAAIVTGLCYLFLTNLVRNRVWKTLVVIAWILAGIQIIGGWVMPIFMNKVASSSPRWQAENLVKERIGYDFDGARKAGISDVEIVLYLRSKASDKFDFDQAIQSGMTPTQVIEYIKKNNR